MDKILSFDNESRPYSKRKCCTNTDDVRELTSNLLILFFPSQSSSRFTSASRFSIFWSKSGYIRGNAHTSATIPHTRIRFPPSSRLRSVAPRLDRYDIFEIRFCTKYTVRRHGSRSSTSGMDRRRLNERSRTLVRGCQLQYKVEGWRKLTSSSCIHPGHRRRALFYCRIGRVLRVRSNDRR